MKPGLSPLRTSVGVLESLARAHEARRDDRLELLAMPPWARAHALPFVRDGYCRQYVRQARRRHWIYLATRGDASDEPNQLALDLETSRDWRHHAAPTLPTSGRRR